MRAIQPQSHNFGVCDSSRAWLLHTAERKATPPAKCGLPKPPAVARCGSGMLHAVCRTQASTGRRSEPKVLKRLESRYIQSTWSGLGQVFRSRRRSRCRRRRRRHCRRPGRRGRLQAPSGSPVHTNVTKTGGVKQRGHHQGHHLHQKLLTHPNRSQPHLVSQDAADATKAPAGLAVPSHLPCCPGP